MIIRKSKNTIEILKSYDAIKTLKFIFKNHRKFYYYLSIPYKTKHKIKNKIFINYYDANFSDQIKNYYIY